MTNLDLYKIIARNTAGNGFYRCALKAKGADIRAKYIALAQEADARDARYATGLARKLVA